MPLKVQAALEDALEVSVSNVPKVAGPRGRLPRRVGVDGLAGDGLPQGRLVEGARASMSRRWSRRRCCGQPLSPRAAVRAAGRAHRVQLDPSGGSSVNAAKLAAIGGGGTASRQPLALLNREKAAVDLVVIVSDNQSWVDARRPWRDRDDAGMGEAEAANPGASSSASTSPLTARPRMDQRRDILNVGGFSDAVFDTIARFRLRASAGGVRSSSRSKRECKKYGVRRPAC